VRNAGESFFIENSEGDLAWLVTVELVRCIGLAASSLRRGGPAALRSGPLTHLRQGRRISGPVGTRRRSSARVSLCVLPVSAMEWLASMNPFCRLAALRPGRTNYMNGFARRQYARGRGILWQSQQQGNWTDCCRTPPSRSARPTGPQGKNARSKLGDCEGASSAGGWIASLRLALYLVPSRALAGESRG